MEMTEDEIVWRYGRADNKRKIIGVLSQLNACDRKDIEDVLRERGIIKDPKKGLISKEDMDKMTRKTISKEDVEEIKALARGEEPKPRYIPEAVRETLEQEIASINVYIAKLQAKRNDIEVFLGWDKVDESIQERLKGQQA